MLAQAFADQLETACRARACADLNKGVEEAQAKQQLPELEGLLGSIKEVRIPDRIIQVALHQVGLQALQHAKYPRLGLVGMQQGSLASRRRIMEPL